MTRLKGIDGIGENNSKLLKQVGIHSVQTLLNRGASIQGRRDLAKNTGISESQLMRWLNNADLFRIRGIGEEYVELLELAGIETVSELTQRNPVDLHRGLIGANDRKHQPGPQKIRSDRVAGCGRSL